MVMKIYALIGWDKIEKMECIISLDSIYGTGPFPIVSSRKSQVEQGLELHLKSSNANAFDNPRIVEFEEVKL